MAKEIIWSESALIDRFIIYQFWLYHNKSVNYSEKLEKVFLETSVLISHYPEIGIQTDFPNVRVKTIGKHYKLFYRISFERVEIIRVWDARQNPDNLKIL